MQKNINYLLGHLSGETWHVFDGLFAAATRFRRHPYEFIGLNLGVILPLSTLKLSVGGISDLLSQSYHILTPQQMSHNKSYVKKLIFGFGRIN